MTDTAAPRPDDPTAVAPLRLEVAARFIDRLVARDFDTLVDTLGQAEGGHRPIVPQPTAG